MRWAREPLVHFLVLGAALFGLQAWWGRGSAADADRPAVRITADDVARLRDTWAQQAGRAPTDAELTQAVADLVREEVLFREALALGLHTADHAVRTRLAEAMEFAAEEREAVPEPDDTALQAFLTAHAADYRAPDRLTFTHRFFDPDRRGDTAAADARSAAGVDPPPAGDPCSLGTDFAARSSRELRFLFGRDFMAALQAAPLETWTGPVRSTLGWHVVRLMAREPGALPPLAEVWERVAEDWRADRLRVARDRAYAELRARYRITYDAGVPVPAPR